MEFYRSALPNLRLAGDDDAICECSLGMANLFRKKGNQDSCLYYARLSAAAAKKGGFTKRLLNAGNFLADYYKSIQKIDSAYLYLNLTVAAKDSLFSQEKSKQIQNLSFTEMLRQQEISEEATSKREERNINIQNMFIAVGLVSFTILFFLLSNSVIVNEKWIKYLGIIGLLFVFEFINLFIHPYISYATHHSPLGILLISVVIAALIVPLHHRAENLVTHKIVEKNKILRLAAAQKLIAKLEAEKPR